MRFCLVFILILLAMSPARAEYRAFQLVVTNRATGANYSVMSNLDDMQYPMYYPISSNESIVIAATWMCWDRPGLFERSFQSICPNPRAVAPIPAPPKN